MKILFSIFSLWIAYAHAQDIQWQTIESESTASFRALSVIDDQISWVAGSNGTIGISKNGGQDWTFNQVKGYEYQEFRSLYAFDDRKALIASAGSPGSILTTSDGGTSWKVVYNNGHPDFFIDGMDFWDDQFGMVYGDAIDGKMLLLLTEDGGLTWRNLQEDSKPTLNLGESSFAASGTGIRCVNKNSVFISSGGAVTRLWVSNDKGTSWKSFASPMLHGENSTGILSFDVKENHIITVGGDYLKDTSRVNHVFFSNDLGLNWKRPTVPTRGYRECVLFIDEHTAIAVGPTGFDISSDLGDHWEPLSDEKGYHVARKSRSGNRVIAAGSKGKIAILK